ncbi:hypothetical protein N7326_02400 [Corynebacterium sp. ES2794-CONJ1]|uniref:hypothetical protein n=1 Tax=unclassified Corynebacterium TaxID=2624378 RepID=UPI00216B1777|nr:MULTISPECIES: hypothetical protein [unclassified Corynebacterium]MCS4531336.1 hypothetical protein [Corynebacterium sp. ES2730-CONJ]MCU9518724.1 hypothetical protein [Corynebacterium sp. ES2794-CONJ1]
MSTVPLPRPDQPDHYTGTWNRVHVHTLYPDTSAGVWHLSLPDVQAGSYCTQFNPVAACPLPGKTLRLRTGGYFIVERKGITVGRLMRYHQLIELGYHETALQPCPDCLTMAGVAAEMIGQSQYPVKTLLKQMKTLPPQPVQ